MRVLVIVGLLGLVALSGCGPNPPPDSDFVAPDPMLEKQIIDIIARLQYLQKDRLVQAAQRLAYIGEPAIPYLFDGLRHDSALTRSTCAYALGLMKDPRTFSELSRVAEDDDVSLVRYEAAASLAMGGDSSAYPVLLDGLEDKDIRGRWKCYEMLKMATGRDFGYEADGEPEKRKQSVAAWKAWWEEERQNR
jgi:HEAT repeats